VAQLNSQSVAGVRSADRFSELVLAAMAEVVGGVEQGVEAPFNVPAFDGDPLCDDIVKQPFLFVSSQVEDICGETLFCQGQRPRHDLCYEHAEASKKMCAQRRKNLGVWMESDDLRNTHGATPSRCRARSIEG
jgi:hypothetical protein